MPSTPITSSQARKNFYKILKRVGESGENFTIKVYKDAKVRIIREDLAEILEQLIGPAIWTEIHKLLEQTPKIGEGTRETIRKMLKSKLG
ncbi:hypothetical protein KKB83_05500 [Patescibacteria group bacterium]|nr:hypothetical protein [Patescibacteria group bacterium]